jgi:hypothetical protein
MIDHRIATSAPSSQSLACSVGGPEAAVSLITDPRYPPPHEDQDQHPRWRLRDPWRLKRNQPATRSSACAS